MSKQKSLYQCAFLWLLTTSVGFSESPQNLNIDQAIDLAADFMVRHSHPNGQFVYRINTNPNVRVAPKYNMLRHAGGMYALADYHRLGRGRNTEGILQRANRFLKSQVGSIKDVPETLAVWSDPKIHRGNDPRRAKLGGTGLGLVAMAELEKMWPNSSSKSELTQLGNFLLFMQKDDGGFYSIYHPEFPGRDDRWTSLYYPGEAALGLLTLNDVVPDPEWIRGAREALLFLARERKGRPRVPADHWALIATGKLLGNPTRTNTIDRKRLLTQAEQIARSMLAEQKPQHGHPKLDGCFSPDGRTTPTATRLEGLFATLKLLPNESPLRTEIDEACHRGVRFLMRSQITDGSAKGGIPRAFNVLPKSNPGWSPEFNERATEIRIDYVQHALSAWLRYRDFYPHQSEASK